MDKETNEDKTDEFLESDPMKTVLPRMRVEEVAHASGFGRLYSMMYAFDSIYAHGTASGLHPDSNFDAQLYTSACAAVGYIQCINLISLDWLTNRKLTPVSTLSRVLGIPLDAP